MSAVFIDIETLPDLDFDLSKIEVTPPANYKKQEAIDKWITENGEAVRDKEWRKQALSADCGGRILSIQYAVGDEPVTVEYGNGLDDEDILLGLFDRLRGLRSPGYFVGHNVPFDLEFIWKRAVINGLRLPCRIPWDGRHKNDYFDTMQAWAGFKGRISLDRLCGLLGIQQKPDGIDGSKVLDHFLRGEHIKIQEYGAHDVEVVREIYSRIK